MPTKEQVMEWKEKVDGNPDLFFAPDEFKTESEELEKMRNEFNEKVTALAEDEIRLRMKQQNLLLAIRDWRKEQGDKEAFSKDINFVQEALDVGLHIVHMIKIKPQR